MTVHNWGEDPRGTWTLTIEDTPDNSSPSSSTSRGRLHSWSLTLYGVEGDRRNHKNPDADTTGMEIPSRENREGDGEQTAREVDNQEVKELMANEEKSSDSVRIESKDEEIGTRSENEDNHRDPWRKETVDGLEPDDLEFLRRLFEAEELISKKNREHSNRHYDGGLHQQPPGHGSRASSSYVDRSRSYDADWNPQRRFMDENKESDELYRRDGAHENDIIDRIVEDLNEYIDKY